MNADQAVKKLIKKLQDPSQMVRIRAATQLGSMGHDAKPSVPALIELLQNGTIHDRKRAALTLGEIGPAAQEAVPALFAAMDDEDDTLSDMAEEALERVDLIDEAEAA